MIFYLFSFLSGFFEIGPMTMILGLEGVVPLFDVSREPARVWDAARGPAIPLALGAALCYQLGNLIPSPLKLSRRAAMVSAALSVAGFFFFAPWGNPGSPWILLPAVFFCSAAIQAVRGEIKSQVPQTRKRLVRIFGFGSGFFCSPRLAIAGAVILFTVIFWDFLRRRRSTKRPDLSSAGKRHIEFSSFRFGLLDRAMVFHQMHFFTYCYIIIIVARQIGGTWMAILVFLPGWFSYTLSENIYLKIAKGVSEKHNREEPGERKSCFPWQIFFVFGHSLLIVLLLGIYLASSLRIQILLWVLTGLGGTTVFCIKKLKDDWRGEPTVTGCGESQAVAENTGHIIGTLCCMFVCVTGVRLLYVFPLSAAFTGITIAMMLISIRRHKDILRRKG
ncbi:MAG: hypothetical protein LBF78_06710 [Treponema sp.]|jgi:hypothetical protein|nr:hypothetical protein [Treponema sp.]